MGAGHRLQCWPFGQHCSDLDCAWLLSGFTAVFEPVAFAVHLEDVDVMGKLAAIRDLLDPVNSI